MSAAVSRATCRSCGAELPPRPAGQRGRPQVYCAESTGRPCRLLDGALASVRAYMERTLKALPSAGRTRALHHFRAELRVLSQDATLTAAELDGDSERAAAVGSRDPAGFFGD